MRSLLTLVLVFNCVVATAAPELKGTPEELKQFLHPDERTVTIRGFAEETAYSDLAHVNVIVTVTKDKLATALQGNAQLRARLINEFLAGGIAEERINNTQFSSSPQYGIFGKKPNRYEIVNRLKVTVDSEAQMTLLASAADLNDEVAVGNIDFEHSDRKGAMDRVRKAALDDAMASAEAYAAKLGLKLQPVSFSFSVVTPPMRHMASGFEEVVVTAARKGGSFSAVAPQMAAPPITFGEVEYPSFVDVIFELER